MDAFYLYRKAWRYDGAPHEEPRLNKEEARALLKKGGLLVRNTYGFDCSEETAFWNLIKDRFEGLEGLSSGTRNRVQKSLEHLDFRRIGIETVQEKGYPILKATFDDYAIVDRPMDEHVFQDYLDHCRSKDYEYWGVFDRHDDRFIGFCANRLWQDAAEYGVIGIDPSYKHNGTFPYYGLFYSMNRHYLQERGFRYVTDGSRSITEHSHIQGFLIEKFLFRKSHCHLAIHYRWWMGLAVKLLYPFRRWIASPRVKAILNMESMKG
ncbi:MAG: hypothetical protein J6X40_02445 [Bacteroidales bacterium]|nr:hypothetical protein [Bacteroidales bacterium]